MKYRPEIDGLRAVAIIPVILFHAGFQVFGGGFVGVDVFFVISGFLITSIISEELNSEAFSVINFYERRARRILPALFTVCAACTPFAFMWMSPSEFRDFSRSLLAVTAFSSNILFWKETGYFAPAVELKPLLHTWSLAVEEQFYLFFPLLLLAVNKFRPNLLMAAIVGMSAVSFFLALYESTSYPSANFYLIPTRAWELGVGAILAISARDFRHRQIVADAGSALGSVLILYAAIFFTRNTPYPSQYTVAPVLGTALIIKCSGSDRILGPLLRTRAVVGIGLISYSLYLWHQPLLAFLRLRSAYEPNSVLKLLAIVLTFVMATLSWRFVEAPFRDRRRFSRRGVAIFATLAGSLLVSVGLAGHFTQGFPTINEGRAKASLIEAKLSVNYGLSAECEGRFTLAQNCRTDDRPKVAVWGDSFAMHLVDALQASNPNVKLIQFTKSVCGPILGLAPMTASYPEVWSKECIEFNNSVVKWLTNNTSVKYVILSSSFKQYSDPRAGSLLYTNQGTRPIDAEFTASRILSTLDLLKKHGITPIVVSPPPNFGNEFGDGFRDDIGRCLYRSTILELDRHRCDFDEIKWRDNQKNVINILKKVEKHYRVIWLSDFMCHGGKCLASKDGIFLYRDVGHLSREGSAFIGAKYFHSLSLFGGIGADHAAPPTGVEQRTTSIMSPLTSHITPSK